MSGLGLAAGRGRDWLAASERGVAWPWRALCCHRVGVDPRHSCWGRRASTWCLAAGGTGPGCCWLLCSSDQNLGSRLPTSTEPRGRKRLGVTEEAHPRATLCLTGPAVL